MHIASDTYNFMDLGYFEYPSQTFLMSARIVSALVSYLAGILNLSYPVFIVVMEIIAVIITSISIYVLYKTIIEKVTIEKSNDNKTNINLKSVLILMATTFIVLNCMSLEYLLYAECSVMCLSVLLCIIAARILTNQNKLRYLKALGLVVLATFCYQGSINIFITLVALLLFIDKDKKQTKEIVKQIFLAGTIMAISFILNVIAIFIFSLFLEATQARIATSGIMNNMLNFVPIIQSILIITLISNFNLWPSAITLIIMAISTIIISYFDKPIERLIKYFIIIFIAIASCTLPVFFMKFPSVEPRTSMAIGAIIGISMVYLNSFDVKKRILEKIIAGITIGFFIFNTINTVQIFTAHIATNKVDDNVGISIKYKLEQYEKESGNTVTKVAYYRDLNHRSFIYGYNKKFSSFTQRAFDNYFCILEALNYYCNRKFEVTKMDEKIYIENFAGKNWETYSDEQIVFKGDTMYICTY